MTLAEIRTVTSYDDLKPAIHYLCDKMQKMEYGTFMAYKRTIEAQAKKLEIDTSIIDAEATRYQIYGDEE